MYINVFIYDDTYVMAYIWIEIPLYMSFMLFLGIYALETKTYVGHISEK